jgi:aspartate racemase
MEEEPSLKEKTIGILGGMGPEATAELFLRIIKATPARRDQDHLRIIVDNNPKIPDRTAALVHKKDSPLSEMLKTARNLERAGVDFIVIPCNAAHFYYEDLARELTIPILNMIDLTAKSIKEKYPKTKKAGIIATSGTMETRIFDRALERLNIKVIYPTHLQENVMEAIYGKIKLGRREEAKTILLNVAKYLADAGSDVIVSGCTEASLVLRHEVIDVPLFDPLQILAEAAVEAAFGCQIRYPH